MESANGEIVKGIYIQGSYTDPLRPFLVCHNLVLTY